MPEAVSVAKKESQKGDIVLLSPACASFGLFKNYKERGRLFKEEVNK
jgi:UDP-N-acetylmuramoylalanine--D-glutamate ligase